MASKKTKKSNAKARKQQAVRPVFLIVAGVALLAFGLIVGASLDLAMRSDQRQSQNLAQGSEGRLTPSRQYRPPQFLNLSPEDLANGEENARVPEFLDQEPQRAWAPDTAAAYGQNSPLMAYAVPNSAPLDEPVIAIVIDDVGLNRSRSLQVIDMEGPLTIALMTYASGLPNLVSRARSRGHEVMGHLPMEPMSSQEDPGPGALLTNMNSQEIRQHLSSYLDSWDGYIGINNHMGSRFTSDAARMGVVMDELRRRGLMWLDSKTTVDSAGPAAATAANVPYVERDVFLDNVDSTPAVLEQLTTLENIARSRGYAVGIGHPHDGTIAALKEWIPGLRRSGISLVPITEVLKRRARSQNKTPS